MAALIGLSVLLPVLGLVQLKMLPFDNKSEFQVVVDMPAGTPLEHTAAVLHELGAHLATLPEVTHYQAYAGTAAPINFNGLVRQYYLRSGGEVGDIQVNLVDKHHRRRAKPCHRHARARRRCRPSASATAPTSRWWKCRRARRCCRRWWPRSTVPKPRAGARWPRRCAACLPRPRAWSTSTTAASSMRRARCWWSTGARPRSLGVSQQEIVSTLRAGLAGETTAYLHDQSKYPAAATIQLPAEAHGELDTLLQLTVRSAEGKLVPIRELVTVSDTLREQPVHHKDLLPVNYVVADMAGAVDSPLYGMFKMRGEVAALATPGGGTLGERFISQPDDPYRGYTLKWDGEWQITYETFRDMGAAYAVGLVLIYLLVVAQFGSYLTPLIIMAPIPLTIIGVMPGHALLGAQYTATSMIGMIALAGIIVRNSILLVDFINLQLREGMDFKQAVVNSATTRAQPILLTGLAAMLGAFFILDDPIFNGLAISLIFGILVSTLLTLVVIPLLYYVAYRNRSFQADSPTRHKEIDMTSWQLVRLFAGTFVLLSLALGIPGSPIFVSQWWLAFTAFVGANLLQSALTKWCLMESILRKLGVRPGA